MSAPLHNVSCGSLRPFPLHAARVRVRDARDTVSEAWLGVRERQQKPRLTVFLAAATSSLHTKLLTVIRGDPPRFGYITWRLTGDN